MAWVYFEVYNLTAGGEYTTSIRLEPEDGGEEAVFELSFPSDGATDLSRMSRRLLRVDLGDTEPGRYLMKVIVTDSATGASTLPYYTPVTVNRTP